MKHVHLRGRLAEHARTRPDQIALEDERERVRYGALPARVARIASELSRDPRPAVGILAHNGVPWALTGLACLEAGLPLVPLPPFFSDAQLQHLVESAGLDLILTDDPARVERIAHATSRGAAVQGRLALYRTAGARRALTTEARVTFTSGTTGEPKGVRLGARALLTVARATALATRQSPADRHLCILPFAVLLEEVGGLLRTLLAGGTVLCPSLSSLGLGEGLHPDGPALAAALVRHGASTAILTPLTLEALVPALRSVAPSELDRLRFLGVGGAKSPRDLLLAALEVGLPVYEGYGLSEAASVVCLNREDARWIGSVGRPLPHAEVRIAPDGEILVSGALFDGYLGGAERPRDGAPLATGDLGHLDEEGYLHVVGRKTTRIVTRAGRNVAPEWVETLLQQEPEIRQAAVVGEAGNGVRAVLVPAGDARAIAAAVARVNERLPSYARVRSFAVREQPFGTEEGTLDSQGSPRRDRILDTALREAPPREPTQRNENEVITP